MYLGKAEPDNTESSKAKSGKAESVKTESIETEWRDEVSYYIIVKWDRSLVFLNSVFINSLFDS